MKFPLRRVISTSSHILACGIVLVTAQVSDPSLQSLEPFVVNVKTSANSKFEIEIPLTVVRSYTWPDTPQSGNACLDVHSQRVPASLEIIKGQLRFQSPQTVESAFFMGGPVEAAYTLCMLISSDGASTTMAVEQGIEMSGDAVTGIECAAFMLDRTFFNGAASWRKM